MPCSGLSLPVVVSADWQEVRSIIPSLIVVARQACSVVACLRRRLPYQVEIDNVYHRPGFPQKVGWMWPPRYTPARPVPLSALREGVEDIQAQVRAFYSSKGPDLLGHVVDRKSVV